MNRALWLLTLPLLFTFHCASSEKQPAPPAGQILIRTVASSEDAFAFCANGQVRVDYRISELSPHVRFGTWQRDGNTIRIVWTLEKGGEPVGAPTFCGSVCVYGEYKPFERAIHQSEEFAWTDIRNNADGLWQSAPFSGDCRDMP